MTIVVTPNVDSAKAITPRTSISEQLAGTLFKFAVHAAPKQSISIYISLRESHETQLETEVALNVKSAEAIIACYTHFRTTRWNPFRSYCARIAQAVNFNLHITHMIT